MHYMDANKTNWEKARWELRKNVTSFFEQILQATPHETTGGKATYLLFYKPSK